MKSHEVHIPSMPWTALSKTLLPRYVRGLVTCSLFLTHMNTSSNHGNISLKNCVCMNVELIKTSRTLSHESVFNVIKMTVISWETFETVYIWHYRRGLQCVRVIKKVDVLSYSVQEKAQRFQTFIPKFPFTGNSRKVRRLYPYFSAFCAPSHRNNQS